MNAAADQAPAHADGVLVAPPELTVPYAEALRQDWLSRLSQTDAPRRVDLSQVAALDSAGVQLLVALRRSLRERGQPWQVDGATATVLDVLAVYGLQDLLQASDTEGAAA